MPEASKQAALSAVRSVLIALGSIGAIKGAISEEDLVVIVGAIVTLLSAAWGVWDKYRSERLTKEREAVAVNVGIAVADRTEGKTPPVAAAQAPEVIETFADVVKEDVKTTGLKVTPDAPLVTNLPKGKS